MLLVFGVLYGTVLYSNVVGSVISSKSSLCDGMGDGNSAFLRMSGHNACPSERVGRGTPPCGWVLCMDIYTD